MDKEELINNNQFEELSAAEIWRRLYNKELNCKKCIIEYIDIAGALKRKM